MEPREIRIRVSDWQNRRQIIEEENRVLFEITVDEHHCSICATRMQYVRRVLDQKAIKAEFVHRNNASGELVTFVAIPARPENQELTAYVSNTLELAINL